ncbi:MAG: hypothetical protein ACM3X9_07390 [Bacillota bacterium]
MTGENDDRRRVLRTTARNLGFNFLDKLSQGILKLNRAILKLSQGILKLSQGILKLSQGILKLSQGILKLNRAILKLSQGILKLNRAILKLNQGILKSNRSQLVIADAAISTLRAIAHRRLNPVKLRPGNGRGLDFISAWLLLRMAFRPDS